MSQWFRTPGLGETARESLLARVKKAIPEVEDIEVECCYNVDLSAALSAEETASLEWCAHRPHGLHRWTA